MGISYLVFKSDEKRFGNDDWAIKHASEAAGDRQGLEVKYRALLKSYGLPPEVQTQYERSPETHIKGTGLFMLNDGNGYVYVGFVFPGKDHMGRRNTSSVVCILDSDVIASVVPTEAVARIWSSNDIRAIADGKVERPDILEMGIGNTDGEDIPLPTESTDWPTSEYGLIQINGVVKRLPRVRKKQVDAQPQRQRNNGGHGKWIAIAAGIGISVFIAIIGMGILGTNEDPIAGDGTVRPIEQVQTPPLVTTQMNELSVPTKSESRPETPAQSPLNKDAIKDFIKRKRNAGSQVVVDVNNKYFQIRLLEDASVEEIQDAIRAAGAPTRLVYSIEKVMGKGLNDIVFRCGKLTDTQLQNMKNSRDVDMCLDAFLSQYDS